MDEYQTQIEHGDICIVGAGLAGTEAALTAADADVNVYLYEMRPQRMTPAHRTSLFAELVCSNSLGSKLPDRAPGLLKEELRYLGSSLLTAAEANAVPAGGALAVDRQGFAEHITRRIENHPRITLIRDEVRHIPDGITILAPGPLASPDLTEELQQLTGKKNLAFYDAMAPIVEADSIDMNRAFRGSRYDRGDLHQGDYINCPMNKEEYDAFLDALLAAERVQLRDFEKENPTFFEACLPIEVLAARNRYALVYGPLSPVGLKDPASGNTPYAVMQLRQDDAAGTLYNIVGGQTNLKWGVQKHVFRMVPGLVEAQFVRLGQMHRNTFINAPEVLEPTLQTKIQRNLFLAGQIAGFEGYIANIASGLVAGRNAARLARDEKPIVLPEETMTGALLTYIASARPSDFQPMKPNFGLLPPLNYRIKPKRQRCKALADRALSKLEEYAER